MQNPLISEVKSITTLETQKLVLDGPDAAKLKGKRVALIDDVVSTGGTMEGMEKLIRLAQGEVVVRAAVLLNRQRTTGVPYSFTNFTRVS